MNTNPVRLGLLLRREPELLSGVSTAVKILELMSDRQFRDRRDVNEVLSLKFHVIRFVLADVARQMEKHEEARRKMREQQKEDEVGTNVAMFLTLVTFLNAIKYLYILVLL